jgi:dipeptidyl aminopeptidase/acylaminoacyl peptidase
MPNSTRTTSRRQHAGWVWIAALCSCVAWTVTTRAAAPAAVEARAGLELATVGARAWAPDAALIYLENDEDLNAQGAAARWGYLFYSAALQKARCYSVRDGRILVAENLDMTFEPPPVAPDWIDSGAAIAAADREASRAFRQHRGRLSTMLLMRGAFDEADPDRTTWTLVYRAPHVPALFVVVDAAAGKVRRTWRG